MVIEDKNRFSTNEESPFAWLTRTIVENRHITYPLYCEIINALAKYFKSQGELWFNEQENKLNKESLLRNLSMLTTIVNAL
jgi:hypothetical protein